MLVSPSSRAPASSTTACTIVPIDAARPDGGEATWSMNQPSGDSSARSICDGETEHERLGVAVEVDERRRGRRLGEPVPLVGWAPGTPCSASRASAAGASPPPERVASSRSAPTSPRRCSGRRRAVLMRSVAYPMSIDGCSSSLAVQLEHELTARPRGREHEEPQFVAAHRGPRLGDGLGRRQRRAGARCGDDARQQRGVQQGAARAEVRPHAVLQARDHDDLELAADDGRRRGHDDGLGRALRRERVFGQLAREHLVDESHGRRVGLALDEALCGREEGHGGVECTVGLFGEHARACGLRGPLGREPAALPDRPEHLLDRAAAQGDAARASRAASRAGAARRRGRRVDGLEPAGRAERLDEQLVGRARALVRELLVPQREPQPAEARRCRAGRSAR